MKNFFATLTLGLCTVFAAQSQEAKGVCGTTAEDQALYTDRLQANIASAENAATDRSGIQYVPIHFHLVGDANGAGKHKERFVLDQLCDLNEAYAPMDIRFYLSPHPNYGLFDYSINNNNVYSNQSNSFLMQSRRHANALNVFVVNEVGSSAGGGTILALYNTQSDWVVSRKDQINGNGNGTLPHEIGHFFSLRHTFYGWEVDGENVDQPPCFESGDPGWPIAPTIAPYHPNNQNIPTELQNGSNCSTAADLLCDTPPDYNFGFCADNCSNYTLGAKDPTGTVINPMENNFMSYFSSCTYAFTAQQQSVILADRETSQRNYLDNAFTPAATEINTPATDNFLVSPANGEVPAFFDEVLFEWQPVSGATYYLFEIDVLSTFGTGNYQSFILNGTSKMLDNLQKDRQYYWRVRPFNEYVTCAAHRQRTFVTSETSATREIQALSAWQVAPNPVSSDAPVRLFVSASENFEATVNILDATGRLVRTLNTVAFSAGETTLDLPTQQLTNGLYFVVVENAEGRASRKVSILR